MCHWVAGQDLAQAELSDLQRAEAERLLARRGAVAQDDAMRQRLHSFIQRSETFALPNTKTAYELAHIVFYLSDYGHRDPELGKAATLSLEYAGLVAYLDHNTDLLGELCAALRFAGATPSATWEAMVRAAYRDCRLNAGNADAHDDYHAYLVTGWLTQMSGVQAFSETVPEGNVAVLRPVAESGALHSLSVRLLELGNARTANWGQLRCMLMDRMPRNQQAVLVAAEQSTDKFDAFFEGFARASYI